MIKKASVFPAVQDYGRCTCKGTAPRLRARVLAAGTTPVTVIGTAHNRTEWTTAGPCALNFADGLRSVRGMQHKSANPVSGMLLASTANSHSGTNGVALWSGVRQWGAELSSSVPTINGCAVASSEAASHQRVAEAVECVTIPAALRRSAIRGLRRPMHMLVMMLYDCVAHYYFHPPIAGPAALVEEGFLPDLPTPFIVAMRIRRGNEDVSWGRGGLQMQIERRQAGKPLW
ncbi:hypothetical protein SNOG_01175 [Parastagonospora nodorum SN15]|uniref:Uncharacterized protein n=1 Tax=Phaeosphaeria nodorum (strain SN15 / ATCC MYA-4574 / FGSC 10173) TaxID=321614 RepID=Q0V489_PHANO|nr:hypothetical protein SNOG_01175 [Parastagonospora nodorum SN15]EAT90824.1 hypothetical protein SNOG_01175 [Parastagonospora nodorum SN15]